MSGERRPERGFALLSVLLVVAGAAAISLALALESRTGFEAGRNRVNAEKAYWRARGCLAESLTAVRDRIARESSAHARSLLWRSLMSEPSTSDTACVVTFEAVGSRLNVNAATEEQLIALFAISRLGASRTDLAHALHDWIDADDQRRPNGAERAWYAANRRVAPRNGPLADPSEIAHVRGFESLAATLVGLIGTEPARISLDHAPEEVLATLPGFTAEVRARVLERRAMGIPVGDLNELLGMVSPSAAEGLRERFPELVRLSVAGTESWVITSRASVGAPPVSATVQAEIALAGSGAAVTRWLER